MSDTISLRPARSGQLWKWLLLIVLVTVLILLFARKITQLSLPGLDVAPKTVIIDPKCPTPEQKDVIEKNLKLYGAGFSQGYDPGPFGKNLIAMAKTLGYPGEPTLDDINAVRRFLRAALKKKC
ncbi:MAG: hypothetical protein ACOC9Z_07910 [Chloroflexota bacterium]